MKNGDLQNSSEMGKELLNNEDKGKQVMVMKPSAVTDKPNYHHKYPEPHAKYKDVVEDRKLFMETLGKLHAAMATKFMIPTIGGKELDLHRLFVEVTSRGGIEKVIGDRRWREITAAFNFPSTATNASFVLRKYYMSLLHHYEQIYFFGAHGWNSPPAASSNTPSSASAPSERSAEPVLQHSSSMPNARKRRANGELTSAGPSQAANRSVVGVIDGKFENGYFVTVTVGAQKLRGVLFHPPEQTSNQTVDFLGIVDNSNAKVVRRRRRRKKLSKRDPTHPKPNRSGYNFFFAEQHARLKPLHPGRDREISKMIGDLWNKLTETEKAVYQERGVKDKERYKSEMAVYRERLKTGQIISNAVPLQQRPAEPVGEMIDVDSKMEIHEADLAEADEVGSSSEDSSETEGKKSDESDLETSPDVAGPATQSTGLAADPSIEGDGFELRRRDQAPVEAAGEQPSSSGDAEKVSEAPIEQH